MSNPEDYVISCMIKALERSEQQMVVRRILNEDNTVYLAVMNEDMMGALMEVMILDPRSAGWDDSDDIDADDLYDGGDHD